jgi:hypothetical protein
MLVYRRKTFLAHGVFHLAGVVYRRFFVHAQKNHPLGNRDVPFVHRFRYFKPFGSQRNMTLGIHNDKPLGFEVFHGDAYTRLGIFKFIYNIN